MLLLSVFSFIAVLFYTSMRASLSSSIRLRLELESHHHTLAGKAARLFITQTTRVSLTLKSARTFFLTLWAMSLYLLFFHPEMNRVFGSNVSPWIFILLASVGLFLLADLLIANFSRLHPYALLRLFSPFFLLTWALCWPLTTFLFWCRKRIFRNESMQGAPEKKDSRSEDFEALVSSLYDGNPDQVPEPEVQILHKAMEFQDVKAGDCMIPRSEVVAMEINSSVDELVSRFTSTRLTRILIYRESIENIIGYVHSFELFRKPVSIISVVRPVVVVPETTPIRDLLTLFIKQHRNIALVIDEYGGTSGILTMEDVIEELFGEIDDEHDNDQLLEKKLNEKEYLLSARLEIAYLNEKYDFRIPVSPDYTTLGGFLFHLGEGIPRPKQKLFHDHLRFEVVDLQANRVETVKLILK